MQNFRPEDAIAEALDRRPLKARPRLVLEPTFTSATPHEPRHLVDLAEKMICARSSRREYFKDDLFSESGWEMLLALYCADAVGHRMTISNLCDASGNPATTALRWIEKLIAQGLLSRRKHPLDSRVFFIEFQPSGRDAMRSYLMAAWRKFYG